MFTAEEKTANIYAALGKFQANDYSVNLDAKVNMKLKSGRVVKYDYCTYSNLVSKIREGLTNAKLGFTHRILHEENGASVLTIVFTTDGSNEQISSLIPVGSFSNPQEFASRTTYAKRYSLAMLLGISIDTDNDATDVEPRSTLGNPKKVAMDKAKPAKRKLTELSEVQRKGIAEKLSNNGNDLADVLKMMGENFDMSTEVLKDITEISEMI